MYDLNLKWKEFSVYTKHDGLLQSYMSTRGSVGLSSDMCLHVYFDERPTQEIEDEIVAHWEAITSESPEALEYVRDTTITNEKIKMIKESLVTKPLQDWTPVDRKVWLGLPLSNEELV